jgi:cellulose synthase/poly-beta-1,6-N-acetylglucosamine synthase-like glycosyltransferase
LLVIENDRGDEDTRRIARKWEARHLCHPVAGISRSRNYGAKNSNCEIITFLDDDAIPKKDWLCNLAVEFFDPAVMAVTGLISPLNPNPYGGIEQYVYRRTQRRIFDSGAPNWFVLANFGAIGDGANMAFRRSVFETWPGFNERLGLGTPVRGSEEHNAFFELIKRGHRLVYTPAAVVHHPFPETREDALKRSFRCLESSSAYIVFLFVEEPKYRWELIRFLMRGVAKRTRTQNWFYSRRHEFRALLSGIKQYFYYRQQK